MSSKYVIVEREKLAKLFQEIIDITWGLEGEGEVTEAGKTTHEIVEELHESEVVESGKNEKEDTQERAKEIADFLEKNDLMIKDK